MSMLPGSDPHNYVVLCRSFPSRTQEVRELWLKKHLMEEAMHPCAHQEVALTDLPERPSALVVPGSPAATAPAAPAKTYRKKHSYGHKGRSQRRTTSKCHVPSPSQDQPGEKSHADSAAPAPKWVKADKKSKHLGKPVTLTATGVPPKHRRPLTAPEPPHQLQVLHTPGHLSPLTATAELLVLLEGPSHLYETQSTMWTPSPADKLLLLCHPAIIGHLIAPPATPAPLASTALPLSDLLESEWSTEPEPHFPPEHARSLQPHHYAPLQVPPQQ